MIAKDIVGRRTKQVRTGFLSKRTTFFMSESLHPVKPLPNPEQDPNTVFSLGSLSDSKNKIYDIRNYPDNTDVFVEYVFDNPAPVVPANEDVTDSRYVSIRIQHSFIKMPEGEYTPRSRRPPHWGTSPHRVTDLTDTSHTPFRDLVIRRWKLVQEGSGCRCNLRSGRADRVVDREYDAARVSGYDSRCGARLEPVVRKSGIQQCRCRSGCSPMTPNGMPAISRYNVLRWTSSPQPPFGGYGPSFAAIPRTGQIIGADIMLEYSFVRRHLQGSQAHGNDRAMRACPKDSVHGLHCSLGHGLQISNLFAMQALKATGADPALEEQIIHDTLLLPDPARDRAYPGPEPQHACNAIVVPG